MPMNEQPEHGTTTKVVFAKEARRRLWAGMKLASAAVGCTLGPRGRTVLINRPGQSPVATKDGVTVSRSIRLKDPVERMGADLVREAASQTNDTAGDGTTTATVLTAALVEEGLKLVESGHSPRDVCRGIERAAALVDEMLRSNARPVSIAGEVAQVATVSANGDEAIGALIADAMQRVGREGVITVEDAKGTVTSVAVVEGMRFDRGYLSPYFVTDSERMRATYEGAAVLVTDRKLTGLKDLVPVLERAVQQQRALLIVADEVEGEALQGLVLNRVRGALQVVAIKAPGYGQHRTELLSDVCALTGAQLASASTGTALVDARLGTCKRFVTDARSTTLVGTGATKEAVERHASDLRAQLEDVTLGEEERARLRTRIARLASGVAVLKVGGATEVEMAERRYRIEDALNATRAAAEEGIIPGGGTALHACGEALLEPISRDTAMASDESRDAAAGYVALALACSAPMRRIVENAGVSFDKVTNELGHRRDAAADGHAPLGYNAATGAYEDLVAAGIIDPCKVTRSALRNAVSVAVTFLSLDAVVYDEPAADCTT